MDGLFNCTVICSDFLVALFRETKANIDFVIVTNKYIRYIRRRLKKQSPTVRSKYAHKIHADGDVLQQTLHVAMWTHKHDAQSQRVCQKFLVDEFIN